MQASSQSARGGPRIEDCLSFTLGKAYQQVQQEAKRRLAPFGLTPGQYAVLQVLWETDARSAAALGERLVLDSATMTGLVDRLSREGLVARRAHPDDRRVQLVCLTAAGRALEAPARAAVAAMHAEFDERVGARELATLLARLRRLTVRLAEAPRERSHQGSRQGSREQAPEPARAPRGERSPAVAPARPVRAAARGRSRSRAPRA